MKRSLSKQFADHESSDSVMRGDIEDLKRVIYGDEKTNEKGMKQKVDEMHELLIQANGLKRFALLALLFGGFFAAIKGWGWFK